MMKVPAMGELQRRPTSVRLGSISRAAVAGAAAFEPASAPRCAQQTGLSPSSPIHCSAPGSGTKVLLLFLFFPERRSALRLHQLQNLLARDHAAPAGPGMILVAHGADAFGMLRGQVMHLGAVGLHVVEFPGARIFAHQLPFADADRGITLMLPEQGPSAPVSRFK